MARVRLDTHLVQMGLAADLKQAQAYILSGDVLVGDVKVTSVGESISDSAEVKVRTKGRFVSRGGEKLAHALEVFSYSPSGQNCIDVGASTGGFTDCLLQNRAVHVAAVDVAYGQFAWSLRNDERVTVFERTNIRRVSPQELGAPFDLLVCDASFISLRALLPSMAELIGEFGNMIVLVKPQFELRKDAVGIKGVVRDAGLHCEALEIAITAAKNGGLSVRGLTYSPIVGPEGNKEFLLFLGRTEAEAGHLCSVEDVVREAHVVLGE